MNSRITFLDRICARWRIWWNLCPGCNSDAPAMDTCWVCLGSREYPLRPETKQQYRRIYGI